MPSKQLRIHQSKLPDYFDFISGKPVVVITTQSIQYTGRVISTGQTGITLKNSRNRKVNFKLGEISDLFTDLPGEI